MLTDELIAEIDPQQLPHPYYQLVDVIGLKNTLAVAEHYGGTGVYFPKVEAVIRDARDKLIRKAFNGSNYKELARKYKLSETWIREIVDHKEDGNQLTIEDLSSTN